jgi:putative peptidoglycan lipid II flippase
MPAFIGLIGAGWTDEPTKFALAIDLTRITMPYLVFICLVSLFLGRAELAVALHCRGFAPSLLNITLIAALLLVPEGGPVTARRDGLGRGRGRRAAAWLVLGERAPGGGEAAADAPADDAGRQGAADPDPAGDARRWHLLYQPGLLRLFRDQPAGRIDGLSGLCRPLNQLPLAIIGSALGTAILPAISRAVGSGDDTGAARVQSQAVELAMLLTLPAAVALAVTAGPIVAALFQGGKFTAGTRRPPAWSCR